MSVARELYVSRQDLELRAGARAGWAAWSQACLGSGWAAAGVADVHAVMPRGGSVTRNLWPGHCNCVGSGATDGGSRVWASNSAPDMNTETHVDHTV